MSWKRPENVPYPTVWLRFKAKDLESDELVDYVVQDLPEDRFDDAVEHMAKHYIPYEPLCRVKEFHQDPLATTELLAFWKSFLERKLSVVCFKENSKEIVGLNILDVISQDDINDNVNKEFQSKKWEEIYEAILYIDTKVNMFEHYGIDKYLTAKGLAVPAKYEGRGIGTQIIAARIPLCKALGIEATVTVFTPVGSQRAAEKNGFETNYEERYLDLAKQGEHMNFPGLGNTSIKLMSRRI